MPYSRHSLSWSCYCCACGFCASWMRLAAKRRSVNALNLLWLPISAWRKNRVTSENYAMTCGIIFRRRRPI